MKNLILIAIIAAGWHYGTQALKSFEGSHSQATSMSRTVSDQVDAVKAVISSRLTTVSNPLTTGTKAAQSTGNTNSNPTPTVIIVQRNCAGMDCYSDMEAPMTVLAAN